MERFFVLSGNSQLFSKWVQVYSSFFIPTWNNSELEYSVYKCSIASNMCRCLTVSRILLSRIIGRVDFSFLSLIISQVWSRIKHMINTSPTLLIPTMACQAHAKICVLLGPHLVYSMVDEPLMRAYPTDTSWNVPTPWYQTCIETNIEKKMNKIK